MIKDIKELEQILVPLVIGAVCTMFPLGYFLFWAWILSVDGGTGDLLQVNIGGVSYLIGMILTAVSTFLAFRGRWKAIKIVSSVLTSQCIVCFALFYFLARYILFK